MMETKTTFFLVQGRIAELPKYVHGSPMWHMEDIWKVEGNAIFFVKGLGGKRLFQISVNHFLFLEKKTINTTLYLLDFIGF